MRADDLVTDELVERAARAIHAAFQDGRGSPHPSPPKERVMRTDNSEKLATGRNTLLAAKALIAHSSHWTTGALARDKSGTAVTPIDPSAVCFCSAGALARVSTGTARFAATVLLEEAVGRPIHSFNDDFNTTHADVLAAFDRAISGEGGQANG